MDKPTKITVDADHNEDTGDWWITLSQRSVPYGMMDTIKPWWSVGLQPRDPDLRMWKSDWDKEDLHLPKNWTFAYLC